jgi:hypothetical protein
MSQMISQIRMISTTEFFAQMTGNFASPSRNQITFRVVACLDPFAVVVPTFDAPHPASAVVIVNGVAYISTIHRDYSCAGSQVVSSLPLSKVSSSTFLEVDLSTGRILPHSANRIFQFASKPLVKLAVLNEGRQVETETYLGLPSPQDSIVRLWDH